MFMERLKNLAKILNIFIYTATQISGNWKEIKEADQQMIRGAKAIADKPDGGWVLLPVREADRAIIEQYQAKGFVDEPTHVMHLYKNRGNPMVNVRIYGRFSRNTCRWVDCFVTDFQGHMMEVVPLEVTWDSDDGKTEKEEKPEEPRKKPTKAKKVDIGDLPEVVDDELPFEFDENGAYVPPSSEGGWGSSTDDGYVDPATIVGPFSQDDEPAESESAPEEPSGPTKPQNPAWGKPYGGLDF